MKNVRPKSCAVPCLVKAPGEHAIDGAKERRRLSTWDIMWIHPALAGAGKPVENRAGAAPNICPEKPAIVSDPQLVQRAAAAAAAVAPRVEPGPAPAPAGAAPLFRQSSPSRPPWRASVDAVRADWRRTLVASA